MAGIRADFKKFQRFLRDERKRFGVTQEELAARLGPQTRQNFISKYERGERRLDVCEFIRVAQALGIKPEKLLKRFLLGKSA